jgi:2-oxoglutarate ferredoxin oxidoreductase subunit beta
MSSDVRFTDFKSDAQPTWCPGCGDFGTMNGMMKALAETGNSPDETFVVAGIGCSGKIGTYMRSYALHGVHGRALPVGSGVKIANPDVEVMVAGGDGDGYSIGAGHFIHAVRRNIDMTYVVMGNRRSTRWRSRSPPAVPSSRSRSRRTPSATPKSSSRRSNTTASASSTCSPPA